jgi:hypothetical protein
MRLLAAFWLLTVAVVFGAGAVSASGVETARPAFVQGPPGPAPRAEIAAREPHERSDVLNANGAGEVVLHNKFITAGLIFYTALIFGWILFLGKRRYAGVFMIVAGVVVSLLLYLGVFG